MTRTSDEQDRGNRRRAANRQAAARLRERRQQELQRLQRRFMVLETENQHFKAQLTQLLLFSNAIVRNNRQMTLQLQRLQAPQLPQPPLSPVQYATVSAAAAAGGAGLLLQTDTLSTNSALEPPSLSTLVACAGLTGLDIHPLSISSGPQSPSSAVLGLGAMAAGLRAPVAPPPPQPPQPGRPTLPAVTRVGSPCGGVMMMPAIPGVQSSMFGTSGAPAWPALTHGFPGGVPAFDEFVALTGATPSPPEHALPVPLPIWTGPGLTSDCN